MLLLWQFLSELDDTITQCSPIWFVYMVFTDSRSGSYDITDDVITYNYVQYSPIWCIYMVLTDSRSGSYDVTDDVIMYNHCHNFGAKYLGNEAR